eukprot:9475753-Ditylum_brightwellii.AAC.1
MSKDETPVAFCCTFQANMNTINAHGGCAGCHPKLLNEHVEHLMSKCGLDNYSNTDNLKECLKQVLNNQFLMDNDAYPCSLPQAMKLLEQFKPEALAEATTGKP